MFIDTNRPYPDRTDDDPRTTGSPSSKSEAKKELLELKKERAYFIQCKKWTWARERDFRIQVLNLLEINSSLYTDNLNLHV